MNGFSAPLYDFVNSELTVNSDGSMTKVLDVGTMSITFTDNGVRSVLTETNGDIMTKITTITNNKVVSTISKS